MKRTLKLTTALVLVVAMVATLSFGLVSCGSKEAKVGGSVIIGNSTELSGSDFASAAWGNNAADKDIRDLTNGYACVQQTKAGEYVWDTEVVFKD